MLSVNEASQIYHTGGRVYFLNLMENPLANLCYQGCYNIWASFELRTIGHIIDPRDPGLSAGMLSG